MVAVTGPRIELHEVGRRFGDFSAVRGLTLSLQPGRIHALIGENGAGKSTALKLIAGLLPPTEGSVSVDGVTLSDASPRAAMLRGIGMVHQHFKLVNSMSVAENLHLGSPETPSLVSPKALVASARRMMEEIGLDVDPTAKIWQLSVGEQQRVEIVRVLARNTRVLILDEPTAVLTAAEAVELCFHTDRVLNRIGDPKVTIDTLSRQ
jgi:simple sugar transport system ATP-binding protein